MRIAYVSNNNPFDINNWSGTPYYLISALQKYHEVLWVGGSTLNGASWHHRFLHRKEQFNFLDYSTEICEIISNKINEGKFDAVISATYSMCSQLDINIPLIAFCDLTYSLCDEYLRKSLPYLKVRCMREEEKFLQSADAVIYSSEFARISALFDYEIPAEKLHVLDFGANIPAPANVHAEDYDHDVCRLVFVGRNWEKKGGDKVLGAYKMLKNEGFPCELTVVGCKLPEGTDRKDIEIIPWIDKSKEEDLVRYDSILRKSHFMVLPTQFDAYGIVFCEASAYGVPSIAADVGGVSQPLKEGKNGFLLPPDATPQDYANLIRNTFRDEKLYRGLRIASRHEYENRLNWELWAKKVTQMIEELDLQKKKSNSNKKRKTKNSCEDFYLPVYVINLKDRTDRRKHIKAQFRGKKEFKLTWIDAVEHPIGAVGLWKSMVKAVETAIENDDDIMILCEDDHTFTAEYSKEYLLSSIIGANEQGAELLSCGIGGFGTAVPVAANRYWVDWFWSTQFVVIFKPMFRKILDYDFKDTDTADGVLSAIAKDKMTMYPFVSVQSDFGYSDVTRSNNEISGMVDNLFQKAGYRLNMIHQVAQKFRK